MEKKDLKEQIRKIILEKLKDLNLEKSENKIKEDLVLNIPHKVITASDIESLDNHSIVKIRSDAIITPLAKEIIENKKINLSFSDIKKENLKIALGSDHAGYKLKEELKAFLKRKNIDYFDFGTHSEERVDFNEFAYKVAREVSDGNFDFGIIIDGLGIASSIVANKLPGIRAAVCNDTKSAAISKEHVWSNILTLGSMSITPDEMRDIVDTWLKTPFGTDRYERRVKKIFELERKLEG